MKTPADAGVRCELTRAGAARVFTLPAAVFTFHTGAARFHAARRAADMPWNESGALPAAAARLHENTPGGVSEK